MTTPILEYPLVDEVIRLQRDLTEQAIKYIALQKELTVVYEMLVIARSQRARMEQNAQMLADECEGLRREIAVWKAAAQHTAKRMEGD